MSQILFENSAQQNQFKQWLSETIDEKFQQYIKTIKSSTNELMTREETAEFFSISLPTLHEWTKNGQLNSYRKGNRVYYKRSEIAGSLEEREYSISKFSSFSEDDDLW
ncbi:helix-turn-helix domain-containing protein [Christiangramia sp.]|uniref:helix-turn-helix domain-containing protein n=1 Tax=Christiangramia sp. TaxID=1931228 RepID=UPI002620DEBB|nr:helix-turn-helix domain-containing protein [Christiangramia sp.]